MHCRRHTDTAPLPPPSEGHQAQVLLKTWHTNQRHITLQPEIHGRHKAPHTRLHQPQTYTHDDRAINTCTFTTVEGHGGHKEQAVCAFESVPSPIAPGSCQQLLCYTAPQLHAHTAACTCKQSMQNKGLTALSTLTIAASPQVAQAMAATACGAQHTSTHASANLPETCKTHSTVTAASCLPATSSIHPATAMTTHAQAS